MFGRTPQVVTQPQQALGLMRLGGQQASAISGTAPAQNGIGLDINSIMNLMITMMIVVMMMKMMTGAMGSVGNQS